ncbi:MAG: Zn-dependent exopeptidase M28 [Chloroflexi bacterium]|nr:Zn-dependent exopeptidase M28 [Chloroflexota bacterium]
MKHSRLILASVLIFLLTESGARAQTPDVLVLARVEWARAAQAALPIYAQLRDAAGDESALVIASRARLQSAGVAFRVLDTNARADDYVIASARQPNARADAAQLVAILHDDGKQIVARVPPAQSDALAILGFELQRLDAPIVLRAPSRVMSAPIAMPDPVIAAMIAQVKSSTATNYLRQLSGDIATTIGGSAYTLATRHTNSGTPIQKATQFAYEFLQARGLPTSYHTWTRCGISNRNVIAQKTGAQSPNEIVLVTAHLDDLPSGARAPGADDNASGSVGVMIAAEILSAHQFKRTVRFIFFTGEEQGLCGSAAYANYVAGLGENIVAVYNMDMLGYDQVDGPTLRLYTRAISNPGYAADVAIANTFISVVTSYGLSGNLVPILDQDPDGVSDHYSFWNRGYAGILAIEDDWDDFNDFYHTTNDTVAHINATYFTNYLKASVGTIAHLADYYYAPPVRGDWFLPFVLK